MITIFRSQRLSGILSHQISINLKWLFFERGIRLIGGLFVTAWVARYLGPAQYGLFAYYVALISIFSVISGLGLDGILVREFSRNPKESRALVSKVILLRTITGCICFIALIAYLIFTSERPSSLVFGGLVGLTLIFQANDTIDLWYQSRGENKVVVCIKITSFIIASVIKIILIKLDKGLIYFVVVFSFEASLNALLLIIIYKLRNIRLIFNFEHSKNLIKESWPIIFSNLAIVLYMRIDQIFIKQLLNDSDLGIYSIGIIFSQFWYIFPVILSTTISPYISKIKITSEEKYELFFTKLFRYSLIISSLLIILIYLFSDFLINLFYGPQYGLAIEVLKIHVFTNVFVFMGVIQTIWIINEKKSKILLYKTIVGCAVSIVANIYLLPIYGVVGAAYVAVLAQFFAVFLSSAIFSPKLFLLQMGISNKKVEA
jgi:O-antigen/teichoic acid export membrane protein